MVETFVQSTDDVVQFLTAQHNLIKDMFDDVFSASGDDARQRAFVDLRQLLAVHETAEEMIVHPRARSELDRGDEIVDARLSEERDAKSQLQGLEKLDVGSEEFTDALRQLQQSVVEHADREEAEEFSLLQREIDADDLKRLASAVRAAEAIAPTRPHPGVESAKANVMAGPFASMLDRARDAIESALR
ncbi:hemerythrin domain-containing protein [Mycobacterium yunnanensis]|uniref:Hemerythrin domain-containing protein n=1 Tax=Mycobacterium yunnanensis TaxID=368477 RepID=A0A9X2Z9U2_9MYCO|nr:hemerythrin domain-containing protein [Mycobacterium yunnanensis]MCV7424539.1 hemerythrin domain-containing protein [Mycobacterium yunnanensis]